MAKSQGQGPDITELLLAWKDGDPGALDHLTPLVYAELQRLAHRYLRDEQRPGLQTTELVHEAYLRLVGSDVAWQGRAHFYVVAARQMRRILVDLARRRAAGKRGAGIWPTTLVEGEVASCPPADVLALDEALKELASFDERKSRVIELAYFTGLTIPEIGAALGISTATVERDLRTGRAWLAKSLRAPGGPATPNRGG
ncbi:MAG: sigma-70 family RNA polymerase sigma factor [Acidobacteriota bacterium]